MNQDLLIITRDRAEQYASNLRQQMMEEFRRDGYLMLRDCDGNVYSVDMETEDEEYNFFGIDAYDNELEIFLGDLNRMFTVCNRN